SPAGELAKRSIDVLTLGLIPSSISIVLLAILKVIIGLFLILGLYKKGTLEIAMVHLFFTFSPFLILPYESFTLPPIIPTLLGQFILKNIIIFAALFTLCQENCKV
ncbi:MAG: doxx family protein, partial [Maribacter sp.]